MALKLSGRRRIVSVATVAALTVAACSEGSRSPIMDSEAIGDAVDGRAVSAAPAALPVRPASSPVPSIASEHLEAAYGLTADESASALRRQAESLASRKALLAEFGADIVDTEIDTASGALLVTAADEETARSVRQAGFEASVLTPAEGLAEAELRAISILTGHLGAGIALVGRTAALDGLEVSVPSSLPETVVDAVSAELAGLPVPVAVERVTIRQSASYVGELNAPDPTDTGAGSAFYLIDPDTGEYFLSLTGHQSVNLGQERYETNTIDSSEDEPVLIGHTSYRSNTVDLGLIKWLDGLEWRIRSQTFLEGDAVTITHIEEGVVGMTVCRVSKSDPEGSCGEIIALQDDGMTMVVDLPGAPGDSGSPVFTVDGAAVGVAWGTTNAFGGAFLANQMTYYENRGLEIPTEFPRVVYMVKRNHEAFAIDGNRGAGSRQNVHLWDTDLDNINQQWIEIPRGDGYYSYQKFGTDFCLDGGDGGARGQNVYLFGCRADNHNQHWKKVTQRPARFSRLEKRNSPGFSIDGSDGAANGNNVKLWTSDDGNSNQDWRIRLSPNFDLDDLES